MTESLQQEYGLFLLKVCNNTTGIMRRLSSHHFYPSHNVIHQWRIFSHKNVYHYASQPVKYGEPGNTAKFENTNC